ncbi:MAG: (2Fe-2S)-binding protein [Myxococcales bacterium]|nr:(2Fe-2S)-binding protein [Myxococcales bacterium]
MFERRAKVRDRVSFTIDGREIEAERGEPLAVALLAAGEGTLARSPKLHRPRGPACLRGDCDGCLARVDGVPNVMTCLADAHGGEVVEAQNVLGSRKVDLLRMTDWFFPKGIDHHHLMAGIPGVQNVMQTFARQMAGIGKLPERPADPLPAARIDCDVLVVGAGLAGLSCAAELSRAGVSVLVVDDGHAPGGSANAAGPDAMAEAERLTAALHGAIRSRTTCAGFYDRDALLAGKAGALIATPKIAVAATGAHDGVLLVAGNDLPGVMGARAVASLAHRGIVPSAGAVIVGSGPFAAPTERALGARALRRVSESEVEAIEGSSRVEAVKLKSGERITCGVVAVATPPAPSFELAEQRGAKTTRTESGFAVVTDDKGRAAEDLYAVGEACGAPFDVAALIESGARAARAITAALA